MADYYSILKRTIAGLPESTGAARRGVYTRARNAIVNQLKAYDPPLSPSEITAEQLRLEEAIRKVEAEAARNSLGLGSSPEKTPENPAASQASSVQTKEQQAESKPSTVTQKVDEKHEGKAETAKKPLQAVVDEAAELGGASHKAVQSARDTMALATRTDDPDNAVTKQKQPKLGAVDEYEVSNTVRGESRIESDLSAPSVQPGWATENKSHKDNLSSGNAKVLRYGILGLIALCFVGVIYSQSDSIFALFGTSEQSEEQVSSNEAKPAQTESEDSSKIEDRVLDADGKPAVAPDARTVTTTLITPSDDASTPAESQLPSDTSALNDLKPQNTDESQPDASRQTQRSILYEEGDGVNGAGTASQGEVVWSVEAETGPDGKPTSILIANAQIPERNIGVLIRIKPNNDSSLPASHLVEIKYDFPREFSAGDVTSVPGLVMKPTEEARGDGLIGASAKVSPGYFWIALSSLESEKEKNLALLRDRGWIDIPMLYETGKRGILTLEKGLSGTAAVEEALELWK